MPWPFLQMSESNSNTPITFEPAFRQARSYSQFRAAASELPSITAGESPVESVDAYESDWAPSNLGIHEADKATWRASLALLTDLHLQGWRVLVSKQQVLLERPSVGRGDEERERRQVQLAVKRSDQLSRGSVRAFISKMEMPGMGMGQRTITDLVADGDELARSLYEWDGSDDRIPIVPELVPVVTGKRCPHTGFLLTDIWRYFRHTWTSPYESVPGRSLLLLVRDTARENHPVMGIAALASAAVKQKRRDAYIGWTLRETTEIVRSSLKRRWKHWIERTLKSMWAETYLDDLVADSIITSSQIESCGSVEVERLRQESRASREEHQRQPDRGELDTGTPKVDSDWMRRSVSPLFRSKRCEKLAMLADLWALHESLAATRSRKYAEQLIETRDGQTLLDQVVRLSKARLVGTAIADLSVCGAVAPYNEIVGGKLVALLAVSEAARQAYRERYQNQASIIASSVAGRKIVREAELVFVGTSSLYGVRPNQYDSLSMPVSDESDNALALKYKYLGQSEGYGSLHIRQRTKARLQEFMEADGRSGWRANNIFGEGANPNMRALREAIGELGLDANELLQHSQPRAMYGVRLATNVTEYLLGLDSSAEYIKRRYSRGSDTDAIAAYWWSRWASRRAIDPQVHEKIRKHSLAYPISHGAVLNLPRTDANAPSMFADL